MSKIIAIDLDEVLAETIEEILKEYNYNFNGIKANKQDIINYNLWEIDKYNFSFREVRRLFLNFLLFTSNKKNIKPVDGALDKLEVFQDKGYKMIVVTARPFILGFITRRWLRKNFKGFFSGIKYSNSFMPFAKKKSDICKKINAKYIIEDSRENALECSKEGINVFLIDKPWNKDFDEKKYDNIRRVNNREEINIL